MKFNIGIKLLCPTITNGELNSLAKDGACLIIASGLIKSISVQSVRITLRFLLDDDRINSAIVHALQHGRCDMHGNGNSYIELSLDEE